MKRDSVTSEVDLEGQDTTQQLPMEGWLRAFGSLRISGYRAFWLGMLAAYAGLHMQLLARYWLVFDLTGSPMALGLVAASWGLPIISFSLFGGVIADRMAKRNLLVIAHGVKGVISLAIAFLVATEAIALWHILGASVLSGIVFALSTPGRHALISELVERKDLLNAIALNSSGISLNRIVAPALGGFLVGFINIEGVYFVIAALYLISMIALLRVPLVSKSSPRSSASLSSDILAGLRYVKGSPNILSLLILSAVVVIFAMFYQFLLPVFAADILGVGASGLGLLMGTVGVGALVANLALAYLGNFQRNGLLMTALLIVLGGALILFSLSNSLYISLICLLFVGMGSMGLMTLSNTVIQGGAAEEMRGRVMSLYMISWGFMPLGAIPASALAESLGAPLVVGAGAIIMMVVSLSLLARRPLLKSL